MSYSQSELRRLRDAAAKHVRDLSYDKTPCNWLYRNKDHWYFEQIKTFSGGVMSTIMKDHGGDPRSPINGQLRGLFFLANNDFGKPPSYSFFGPARIQIRADELFRLAPNLYFADFYCMGGGFVRRHYVIVVMTKTDSSADLFCRQNLVPLDHANNPFLFFNSGRLYTSGAYNFDVEVFFTENLNITELQNSGKAHITTVATRGQGHSTLGGKKKIVGAKHVTFLIKQIDLLLAFCFKIGAYRGQRWGSGGEAPRSRRHMLNFQLRREGTCTHLLLDVFAYLDRPA